MAACFGVLTFPGCTTGQVGSWPISADGFEPIGLTSHYTGVVELQSNGFMFVNLDSMAGALWVVWPEGTTCELTGRDQSHIRLSNGSIIRRGTASRRWGS